MKRRQPAGPLSHPLEDEGTDITRDPGDAERPPQQRHRTGAAAQLSELSRHRSFRQQRQPRRQLDKAAVELFDGDHLAPFVDGAGEVAAPETVGHSAHDVATAVGPGSRPPPVLATAPSR